MIDESAELGAQEAMDLIAGDLPDEEIETEAGMQGDGTPPDTGAESEPGLDEANEFEPEAEVEAAEGSEGDPEAGDTGTETEEGENSQTETLVAAPSYLNAEDKARFDGLPREAKQLFAELERGREAFKTKKLQEAAAVRKQAEQRLEEIGEFVTETEKSLKFYQNVDWVKESQRVQDPNDPLTIEQFIAEQAHFNRLKEQHQKAQDVRVKSEQEDYQRFLSEERQRLQDIAPELASNPEKIQSVAKYLVEKQGYEPDLLKWASANDFVIANKAMLYDEMVARNASAPKPKGSKATGSGVKPSTVGKPNPQSARKRKLAAKKGSWSVQDAIDFIDAD